MSPHKVIATPEGSPEPELNTHNGLWQAPISKQQTLRTPSWYKDGAKDLDLNMAMLNNNNADDDEESSRKQQRAVWELQKALYLKAGRSWECPLDEVLVPHIHHPLVGSDGHNFDSRVRHRGEQVVRPKRLLIPVYVRLPLDTLQTGRPCPTILILTDDRTGHTAQCEEFLSRGWGCVIAEVPGTGDCPVAADAGADAAKKLWSSVLDWMKAIRVFDMEKIVVWGVSDAVIGMAGAHGGRLRGCVAQAPSEERVLEKQPLCRLLTVTEGPTAGSYGLWAPVVEDNILTLLEYGGLDGATLMYPVADAATVYSWVEGVMGSEDVEMRD